MNILRILNKAIDKMEALIQHNNAELSTWIPLEYVERKGIVFDI